MNINLELKDIYLNFLSNTNNVNNLLNYYNPNKCDLNEIITLNLNPIPEVKIYNSQIGFYKSLDIILLEQELSFIYFSWLIANKNNITNAVDIGSNFGLHSLFMSKFFEKVQSYDADPNMCEILNKNIILNNSKNIHVNNLAVSNSNENQKFLVSKDNPTINHLKDSKVSDEFNQKYKDFTEISVKSISFKELLINNQFFKIDIEGYEHEIFSKIDEIDLINKFICLEVHNEKNSRLIFNKLISFTKVKLYSLKNRLKVIDSYDDFPKSASDGMLIITNLLLID